MSDYFVTGHKALSAGKGHKAISMFKKFIKLIPCKEGYLNLGSAYRLIEDDASALECYLLAADDSVAFANGTYGKFDLALNNIGLLSYSENNMSEALAFFNAALEVNPYYGEAIWNISCTLLKSTNCATGWAEYEWRFNRGESSVKIKQGLPVWDLSSCGSSICVQTEQGFGDKIQFGRYLEHLHSYFPTVTVLCHPSQDVFFSGYKCVRELEGEFTIPMCSLVQKFGIVDCLASRGRLNEISAINRNGFNIAVCNAGSLTHANNKYRSCPIGYMSSLSTFGNLYSLDPAGTGGKNITPLSPRSWEETIGLIRGMQLVVTVDTSIVHLAGTLGIPCLMLQPRRVPDFRWGMPGDKNVWYDSVITIDNDGTWDNAFDNVREIMKCIKA